MPGRMTEKQFLRDIQIKFKGYNYDFSEVEYNGSSNYVTVICNEETEEFGRHGRWYVVADHALGKSAGCLKCSKKYRWTTKTWIKAARRIWGETYGYSRVKYVNNKTKVKIRCRRHNYKFYVRPRSHIYDNQGCSKCADNYRPGTKEWIKKAKEVHGDTYDYSEVVYVNNNTKVTIICKKHGEFKQLPRQHSTTAANGCPDCIDPEKYSKPAIAWLDRIMEREPDVKIQHAANSKEYRVPGTKIRADGYDEKRNTIYEFYGDYWHGNPDKYDFDKKVCKKSNKTYGSIYYNTKMRERKLLRKGYRVLYIWQEEWLRIKRSKKKPLYHEAVIDEVHLEDLIWRLMMEESTKL
jgi:hypothetical protein